MKPWYESSDIEGLYFAGAQMHGRDYKRGNNGFIHGFRYSIRALHRWLEQEAEDVTKVRTIIPTVIREVIRRKVSTQHKSIPRSPPVNDFCIRFFFSFGVK